MLEFDAANDSPFPQKEITEAIIGAAFEVHNHLGYGFLHRVYQRALQVELAKRNHRAELEQRTNVQYKDVIVGDYDADLIFDDGVLVEIKIEIGRASCRE